MRILFVLHGFPPETRGGTERAVEALAHAVQALGHQAFVAAGSLRIAATAKATPEDHGAFTVWRLQRDDQYHDGWFKAHSPPLSRAFGKLLHEVRPEVVHVHHWLRLSTDLVRLARAAGCTTAVTLHDYFACAADPVRTIAQQAPLPPPVPSYVGRAEAEEAFSFHRRDLLAEVRAAHLRCAPSRSHAEGVQEFALGDLGGIEVTPPPLLEVPARRQRAGARGRRLLSWGSWYAAKGLEDVLAAMRAAGGGWQLEVFGDAHEPGHRARLEAAARGMEVRFRGAFRLRDLEASDADYAVLPSRCHESYGLALDEALLLGLPVLAADVPAYRERAPRDSCALYPAGDANALAALLRDEARLRALRPPDPPAFTTPAAAAARLLGLYQRARAGEIAPAPPGDPVTDSDRAGVLFRRAERRLWTALQQPNPPPPPA